MSKCIYCEKGKLMSCVKATERVNEMATNVFTLYQVQDCPPFASYQLKQIDLSYFVLNNASLILTARGETVLDYALPSC